MTPSDEQDVWSLYAKGVKKLGHKEEEPVSPPLRKKAQPVMPEPPLFEEGLKAEAAVAPVSKQSGIVEPIQTPSVPVQPKVWKKEPLDLRIERNMSLGDVVIEAKLDLHGKTEAEAYDAFSAFIETQQKRGKRMLLVITGKGQDGASVLRGNLPRWCDTAPFEEAILAVRTAAQHHGGDGAYYVLLRKLR
ncbi:MAG: Smr/MutS family protein [Alphaproteobacteria bacterium]|nr:Smr/MutS family protein [Alphaproteobacteria bacterium]